MVGGYRLSGRWKYASCCEHCEWALLGAVVANDGSAPLEGRIFLVPRTQYQSIDTWQVCGLQATGSWDIAIKDVVVPAYRSQSMRDNFLLTGPGQVVNTSIFTVSLRPDFCARDFDGGARRAARDV